MSWNKPGDDDKDPWSGRSDPKGPPDLDEIMRSLQAKLGGLLGGGGQGSSGDNTHGLRSLAVLGAGATVLWALSGFYIVDEGNHGVETRFGHYIATSQAGLNWHIPAPIEQVNIVNVKKSNVIEVGYRPGDKSGGIDKEALMLTKDENIIDVRLAVQYQVKDARQFLFNLINPDTTLRQVTESVERGVVGSNKMDFVLTEGRSEIVTQIKQEIQAVMDDYQAGIQITSVNLQDAQPPEQVQSAFEDAIKAREDKQRLINEAETYANDVVPKARGAAARKIQEAEGYKQQVIAQAEGEVSRFSQLLTEYQKSPAVTRQRLYLESIESVLSKSNTVMVDVNRNSLVYLPLDKAIHSMPELPTDTQAAEINTVVPVESKRVPSSAHETMEHARAEVREERQRFAREERGR